MTAVTKIAPPRAAKRPRVETWHNRVKTDDYAWLRADNWQEVMHDPSVLAPRNPRAISNAENAYLEAELADTKALQEKLFAEMKGRIKEDDSSVPAPDGPYAYYTSFVTGGQQPRFCRKPRDLQAPSKSCSTAMRFRPARPSSASAMSAFRPTRASPRGPSTTRARSSTGCTIRDLATGSDRAESGRQHDRRCELGFRRQELLLHLAGRQPPALEGLPACARHARRPMTVLVYEEKDTGFFTGVGKTQSERFIVIDTHDHETSEVYLIDAADARRRSRSSSRKRKPNVEYDVDHWEDRLIIRTNADGAEDYKIVWAPIADPRPENWSDLVPHRPGTLILGVWRSRTGWSGSSARTACRAS